MGSYNLDEFRVRHLEFIQAVVNRLSASSFLVKGWTISVAGLVYAYTVNRDAGDIAVAGIVAVSSFWGLDGYYLCIERLFRRLYDDVRRDAGVELFSMDIERSGRSRQWVSAALSPALVLFYVPLFATGVALWLTL